MLGRLDGIWFSAKILQRKNNREATTYLEKGTPLGWDKVK